jgi:hypothetical protein
MRSGGQDKISTATAKTKICTLCAPLRQHNERPWRNEGQKRRPKHEHASAALPKICAIVSRVELGGAAAPRSED